MNSTVSPFLMVSSAGLNFISLMTILCNSGTIFSGSEEQPVKQIGAIIRQKLILNSASVDFNLIIFLQHFCVTEMGFQQGNNFLQQSF